MKKIKHLLTLTALTAALPAVSVIATSCNKKQTSSVKSIPTDLLDINGSTLCGLKTQVDIDPYNTLTIPEGIKRIAPKAFENKFGFTSTIHRIVLPKSIEYIGANAFSKCPNICHFDMRNVDYSNLYALQVEECMFGLNPQGYCELLTNSDLSEHQKNYLQNMLIENADIPKAWFTAKTTGNYTLESSKNVEAVGAQFVIPLKLAQPVTNPNDYAFTGVVERQIGTVGCTVVIDAATLMADNTTVYVKGHMAYSTGFEGKTGDQVLFDLTVVCRDTSTSANVKWVQTTNDVTVTYVEDKQQDPTDNRDLLYNITFTPTNVADKVENVDLIRSRRIYQNAIEYSETTQDANPYIWVDDLQYELLNYNQKNITSITGIHSKLPVDKIQFQALEITGGPTNDYSLINTEMSLKRHYKWNSYPSNTYDYDGSFKFTNVHMIYSLNFDYEQNTPHMGIYLGLGEDSSVTYKINGSIGGHTFTGNTVTFKQTDIDAIVQKLAAGETLTHEEQETYYAYIMSIYELEVDNPYYMNKLTYLQPVSMSQSEKVFDSKIPVSPASKKISFSFTSLVELPTDTDVWVTFIPNKKTNLWAGIYPVKCDYESQSFVLEATKYNGSDIEVGDVLLGSILYTCLSQATGNVIWVQKITGIKVTIVA